MKKILIALAILLLATSAWATGGQITIATTADVAGESDTASQRVWKIEFVGSQWART